jgi:hypothetical protein
MVEIGALEKGRRAFATRQCLPAARVAFWLSLTQLLAGKAAQSDGWLARGRRLLRGQEGECVEHGLLLVVGGLFSLFKGEAGEASASFERAADLAELVATAADKQRAALTDDIRQRWQEFVADGSLVIDVDMTTVCGR